jgi:hypothetical protein
MWFWSVIEMVEHVSGTSVRGWIIVSVRIRGGSSFKRLLCFVLIDARCLLVPQVKDHWVMWSTINQSIKQTNNEGTYWKSCRNTDQRFPPMMVRVHVDWPWPTQMCRWQRNYPYLFYRLIISSLRLHRIKVVPPFKFLAFPREWPDWNLGLTPTLLRNNFLSWFFPGVPCKFRGINNLQFIIHVSHFTIDRDVKQAV